jgi:CheY-like chemotaxis protein
MPSERPKAEPSSPSKTVLVVDSEIVVRMTLSEYLRRCGYRVIEAASGEEALTVFKDAELSIDVTLTEVELQGEIDGFQLAAWIRNRRPGTLVILAGTATRAAKAAGDLCEEGPMMNKPYDPQLVVDRIKRLLSSAYREA